MMLGIVVFGYSSAYNAGLRSGKSYGTQGLDLIFKCLILGTVACGLIGLTAFLTRSRDTIWFYYATVVVLCLLSIFIDEWKPYMAFRHRW